MAGVVVGIKHLNGIFFQIHQVHIIEHAVQIPEIGVHFVLADLGVALGNVGEGGGNQQMAVHLTDHLEPDQHVISAVDVDKGFRSVRGPGPFHTEQVGAEGIPVFRMIQIVLYLLEGVAHVADSIVISPIGIKITDGPFFIHTKKSQGTVRFVDFAAGPVIIVAPLPGFHHPFFLFHQSHGILQRLGLSVVEPLLPVAADGSQIVRLFPGFHPFYQSLDPQTLGHGDG